MLRPRPLHRTRTRQAFTYLEAAIVIALMSVTLVLAAGQIGSPDDAGTSRHAQGTAETVLDAVLDYRIDFGTFPDDPVDLATYIAALTDITVAYEAVQSNNPDRASIGFSDSRVTVAVADEANGCWIKVRDFVGTNTGIGNELHAYSDNPSLCSAQNAATAVAAGTPPQGRGTSWSTPWLLP